MIKSRFGIGYLACAFILHIYNIRSFGLFMLLVGLLHNPHEFGSWGPPAWPGVILQN